MRKAAAFLSFCLLAFPASSNYSNGDESVDSAECDNIVFGITPLEVIQSCAAAADEIDLSGAYDIDLSETDRIEAIRKRDSRAKSDHEYDDTLKGEAERIGDRAAQAVKENKQWMEEHTKLEVQGDTASFSATANPYDQQVAFGIESSGGRFQVYGKLDSDDAAQAGKSVVGMGRDDYKSKSQVGATFTMPIPGT
ncbi:MAG: hypothetical protein LBH81_00450 [Rickettsiales bacterium]|jgi:hypothetical protein|nr:hypothetical protein [Rickettsiales bacterium]